MGVVQPNRRIEAANEYAGAVRRAARQRRAEDRRTVWLYFDTYEWEPERIAEALDLDLPVVQRLLASDGTTRCTECAFGKHHACLGRATIGPHNALHECECECATGSACRV